MADEPLVLHYERLLRLLEGTIQSQSDKDRLYRARIFLDSNVLCTCDGSILGGSHCKHLRALLESLSKQELMDWILESEVVPEPIVPEEP